MVSTSQSKAQKRPAKVATPNVAQSDSAEKVSPASAAAVSDSKGKSGQPSGPGEVLGDVAWLMTQSPAHKHLFIADLEWLVIPPVMRKQFRLFRKGGRPFAYASWALLDEEGERRLLAGQHRLRPADWHAGDRLWLIDLVAPFGGVDGVVTTLKQSVFKDRKLMALKPNPDGKGMVAGEVTGESKKTAK